MIKKTMLGPFIGVSSHLIFCSCVAFEILKHSSMDCSVCGSKIQVGIVELIALCGGDGSPFFPFYFLMHWEVSQTGLNKTKACGLDKCLGGQFQIFNYSIACCYMSCEPGNNFIWIYS